MIRMSLSGRFAEVNVTAYIRTSVVEMRYTPSKRNIFDVL
jgi:hypothetical protein